MDTCEKCGAEIQVADWPFCPHGPTAGFNVRPDDIPGGMWQENGFAQPVKVYSWSELNRRLDAEGLQIAPRYVEGNKVGMKRWDTVDLDAAKVLVMRGVEARRAGKKLLEPHPDFPITVSDAGWKVGA